MVVKLTARAPAMAVARRWRVLTRASTAVRRLGRVARFGLFRQGMRRFNHLGETILGDMRVDLRRGNVGVTKHGLYAAKVRAPFYEVGGKGVTQDVRRHFFRVEIGCDRQILQHLLTTSPRDVTFGAA